MSPANPETVKSRKSSPRRWAGIGGGGEVADKVSIKNARRQLAPARILSSLRTRRATSTRPSARERACENHALRPRPLHRGQRSPDSTSPACRHVLRLFRLHRRVRGVPQPPPSVAWADRLAAWRALLADATHASRGALCVGVARRPAWVAGTAAARDAGGGARRLRGALCNHQLREPFPHARRVRVLLERDDAAPRIDHARWAARSGRALWRDPAMGFGGIHRCGAGDGMGARSDRKSVV